MGFWVYMLACNLLTPGIVIAAGWWMWKHPPKDINALIGYRTNRSMQNQETWIFAQQHCGRIWWRIGWVLLILCTIIQLFFFGARREVVSAVGITILFCQLVVLLLSILLTEMALRKSFDKEGNKIE